jgi:hypothetical protein
VSDTGHGPSEHASESGRLNVLQTSYAR